MLPAVAAVGTTAWKYRKPIGFTILGLIAAYILWRAYKKAFPGGIKQDRSLPPAVITDTQAITTAERLFEAMRSSGTDEDAIMQALEGINHNDFVKISDAFGTRSYIPATGSHPLYDWMGEDLDLVEWLLSELSNSEIKRLKQTLPQVF